MSAVPVPDPGGLSSLRAAWLVTRLYARRLWNIVAPSAGERQGTSQESRTGPAGPLMVLCVLICVPGAVEMAGDAVALVSKQVGPAAAPDAVAVIVLCAALCALHGALMAPDVWRAEWSLEWMYTLPVSVPVLMGVRTFAAAATNLAAHGVIGLLLAAIAYRAGWRAGLAPLVFAATTLLVWLVTLARQVLEVLLRFTCDPARLRNVQAAVTAGGFVLWMPLLFVFSPIAQDPTSAFFDVLRNVPTWIHWTPPGLAHAAAATPAPDAAAALRPLALLALQVAGASALAFAWLARRLSGGLLEAGARESARGAARALPAVGPRTLTPFQAKSLTLLARDRNLLVTVVGVPLFALSQQYFLNSEAFRPTTPAHVAVAALAMGALTLLLSIPHVILKETETFWFLQTFPRPIARLFAETAALFGVALSIVPALALVAGMRAIPAPPSEWLGAAAAVAVGMAACTFLAAALTLLWSDPLSDSPARRLSPVASYLYLVLVGIAARALVAEGAWARTAQLTLFALVAAALWQKATDHLPYLMDPSASPPPRVSLSDGLIASQIFFVIQSWAMGTAPAGLRRTLFAFALAGIVTGCLVLGSIRRQQMTGLPPLLGPGVAPTLRALRDGLLAGATAAALGVAYVACVLKMEPLRRLIPPEAPLETDALLILVMTVVCAPAFEELIFRGLVYTGLKRSVRPPTAALATCALFAGLHPPVAALPVFAMGLLATAAFERHGLLIAPIVAHAVYNLVVVGLSLR